MKIREFPNLMKEETAGHVPVMDEKRRIERYELDAPAQIVMQTEEGDREVVDLQTRDISAGGAFFRTDRDIAEGARISAEVVITIDKFKELTGTDSRFRLKVSGTVVRSIAGGVAVRFDRNYEMVHAE